MHPLTITEIASNLASAQIKVRAKRIFVAFSGGMDSTVLLHIFHLLHKQGILSQPLIALHLNHRLQRDSDEWQTYCLNWCQTRNINCITSNADPGTMKSNIEALARTARYAFFKQHLEAGDYLCTAHHQDDQLETFLLRLIRGSGLTGLTAMAKIMPFASGQLYRPLLNYNRNQIEQFARQEQLNWIEDPSNQSSDFDRNYLRHNVVPALKQRWPGITATTSRTTELLAQDQNVIYAYMTNLLKQTSNAANGLAVDQLQQLRKPELSCLLRFWLNKSGHHYPSRVKLQEIQKQMLTAKPDAKPVISYADTIIRRYQQHIYCFSKQIQPLQKTWSWQGESVLDLGIGKLIFSKKSDQHLNQNLCLCYHKTRLNIKEGITITWRQTGMLCKPVARPTKSLKKWLQEYQVPPWLRDRIPVVCCDNQIIAVAGLFICEGWQAKNNQSGLRLDWQMRQNYHCEGDKY